MNYETIAANEKENILSTINYSLMDIDIEENVVHKYLCLIIKKDNISIDLLRSLLYLINKKISKEKNKKILFSKLVKINKEIFENTIGEDVIDVINSCKYEYIEALLYTYTKNEDKKAFLDVLNEINYCGMSNIISLLYIKIREKININSKELLNFIEKRGLINYSFINMFYCLSSSYIDEFCNREDFVNFLSSNEIDKNKQSKYKYYYVIVKNYIEKNKYQNLLEKLMNNIDEDTIICLFKILSNYNIELYKNKQKERVDSLLKRISETKCKIQKNEYENGRLLNDLLIYLMKLKGVNCVWIIVKKTIKKMKKIYLSDDVIENIEVLCKLKDKRVVEIVKEIFFRLSKNYITYNKEQIMIVLKSLNTNYEKKSYSQIIGYIVKKRCKLY